VVAGCAAVRTGTPSAPAASPESSPADYPGQVPIVPPTFSIPQPADINPGRIIGTVYISDHDHYFHSAGCPNLGASPTALSRQAAVLQGYAPDPYCNP
jgi:hypothetical protein